jgi:phosphatidylinositol phospholipase C delta
MVVNISESALLKLLPTRLSQVLLHNSKYGMRVYPHGLRISSRNLDPLPFWRSGAQIAALNFQRYDRGVQMNAALFAGTPGWVLKPPELRGQAPAREGKVKLVVSLKSARKLQLPKVGPLLGSVLRA